MLLKIFMGRLLSGDHGLKTRTKAQCSTKTANGETIQMVSNHFQLGNPHSKELTLHSMSNLHKNKGHQFSMGFINNRELNQWAM